MLDHFVLSSGLDRGHFPPLVSRHRVGVGGGDYRQTVSVGGGLRDFGLKVTVLADHRQLDDGVGVRPIPDVIADLEVSGHRDDPGILRCGIGQLHHSLIRGYLQLIVFSHHFHQLVVGYRQIAASQIPAVVKGNAGDPVVIPNALEASGRREQQHIVSVQGGRRSASYSNRFHNAPVTAADSCVWSTDRRHSRCAGYAQ